MVGIVELHKSKDGSVTVKDVKGYKYPEAAKYILERAARVYSEMHPYGVVINNENHVTITDETGMHEWLIKPLTVTRLDPES